MNGMLFPILLSFQILMGLVICGLVLLQQGKGADMGAAFGSGASGSLFGASGSANFMSRTTAICMAVFFANCLALTYIASNPKAGNGSVMDTVKTAPAPKAPAAPAAPASNSKTKDIPK